MDLNDFIVSTEYKGYVFVGWASGLFEPSDRPGQKIPYANMFVLSPSSDYVADDYEACGFKAEKLKCINSGVWRDLQIGDRVKLFFDDRKRVVMAVCDN